jgi:RNA polymerase sigma factor (sigma-70 family)
MSEKITGLPAYLSRPECDPLTPEREMELGDQFRIALEDGDEKAQERIREELVLRHMRLVVHIGKRYSGMLDRDEVLSVGALSLTQAASRWHPDRGQMYPWAERWITTGLTRAVDAARTIRIPQGVAYKAALAQKRLNQAESDLGRPLTASEKAEVVGTDQTFDKLPQTAYSLDEKAGDNSYSGDLSQRTRGEDMEDEGSDPAEIVDRDMTIQAVRKALEELTELEREIVMCRFGINEEKRMTLAQLGEKHGVTGEAMRRVEATALAKLRHPALLNPIEETR